MEYGDELQQRLLQAGPGPLFSNRIPIIFVVCGLFLDYFTLTSIIPIVPSVLSSSSISPTLIFLLFSSKSLFQIIANPLSGRLVDKYPDDPSRLFAPSLLLLSFSSLLFALGCSSSLLPSIVNATRSLLGGSNSPEDLMADLTVSSQYPLLLVARSLQGLSSSGVLTSGLSFITYVTPPSSRGAALGAAMAGIPLGVLLGPPLGGVGADLKWGGAGVFGLVALAAAVVAALFCLVFNCGHKAKRRKRKINYFENDDEEGGDSESSKFDDRESGRETIPTSNVSEPLLSREAKSDLERLPSSSSSSSSSFSSSSCYSFSRLDPLTSLTFSLVLINTCISVTEPLFPIYLGASPFNSSTSEVGLAFSAMSVSYLVFTPLSGILIDKLEMYTPPLYLGLMLAGLGLCVVFIKPGGSDPSVWITTIPGLCLLGCGVALADACAAPLATLLSEWGGDVESVGVGKALSGVDSAVNIGFLIGPLIAVAVGADTDKYKFLGMAWGAGVVGLYAVLRGGAAVFRGLRRRGNKGDVGIEGDIQNSYAGGWGAEINARRRMKNAMASNSKAPGRKEAVLTNLTA